ncbi:MAG: alkaline phosphatase family protein [Labilithrix sp.]|nr:alkaline phosphatase family protein [Labilithrix sp.]
MADWRKAALAAALVVSCASKSQEPARPAPPARSLESAHARPTPSVRPGPIVLVVLDGVRWQEIFVGSERDGRTPADLAPNLQRLATERGAAIGAPGRGTIAATGPNFVSLPGYTEIFSGSAPLRCADNHCPATETPTLLDDARAAGAKVGAFSSWETMRRAISASPDEIVASCGRSGDPRIDPSPGTDDYRPDRLTADAALAWFEAERPDVFFLGLGDTDEYAHHLDYEGYLAALGRADAIVGRLVALVDRMGERGERTSILVTADHGRARDFGSHGGHAPESARVWLIASGGAIRARGQVRSSAPRYLADVAPTLRVAAGLAPPDREVTGTILDELL